MLKPDDYTAVRSLVHDEEVRLTARYNLSPAVAHQMAIDTVANSFEPAMESDTLADYLERSGKVEAKVWMIGKVQPNALSAKKVPAPKSAVKWVFLHKALTDNLELLKADPTSRVFVENEPDETNAHGTRAGSAASAWFIEHPVPGYHYLTSIVEKPGYTSIGLYPETAEDAVIRMERAMRRNRTRAQRKAAKTAGK